MIPTKQSVRRRQGSNSTIYVTSDRQERVCHKGLLGQWMGLTFHLLGPRVYQKNWCFPGEATAHHLNQWVPRKVPSFSSLGFPCLAGRSAEHGRCSLLFLSLELLFDRSTSNFYLKICKKNSLSLTFGVFKMEQKKDSTFLTTNFQLSRLSRSASAKFSFRWVAVSGPHKKEKIDTSDERWRGG